MEKWGSFPADHGASGEGWQEGTKSKELNLSSRLELWVTGWRDYKRSEVSAAGKKRRRAFPGSSGGPGLGGTTPFFSYEGCMYSQGDQANPMKRKERRTVTFHLSWAEPKRELEVAFMPLWQWRDGLAVISSQQQASRAHHRSRGWDYLPWSFPSEPMWWVRRHSVSFSNSRDCFWQVLLPSLPGKKEAEVWKGGSGVWGLQVWSAVKDQGIGDCWQHSLVQMGQGDPKLGCCFFC